MSILNSHLVGVYDDARDLEQRISRTEVLALLITWGVEKADIFDPMDHGCPERPAMSDRHLLESVVYAGCRDDELESWSVAFVSQMAGNGPEPSLHTRWTTDCPWPSFMDRPN